MNREHINLIPAKQLVKQRLAGIIRMNPENQLKNLVVPVISNPKRVKQAVQANALQEVFRVPVHAAVLLVRQVLLRVLKDHRVLVQLVLPDIIRILPAKQRVKYVLKELILLVVQQLVQNVQQVNGQAKVEPVLVRITVLKNIIAPGMVQK